MLVEIDVSSKQKEKSKGFGNGGRIFSHLDREKPPAELWNDFRYYHCAIAPDGTARLS